MRAKLHLILPVLSFLVLAFEAISQDQISISGIVTYKNIPLNKAKVLAINSGEFTYTDTLGRFNLKSLKKDVLTVSASGFENKKVKVGKQKTYIIELPYKNNPTNFNKAVANGHIAENAILKVLKPAQQKKEKDYSTYSSIYELVSSEIYDVTVTNSVIYNKKNLSLNSEPKVLYVVEGKVVSDISFVAPADVKAIEFIDDASTTMWGVQGANGVLKITLK